MNSDCDANNVSSVCFRYALETNQIKCKRAKNLSACSNVHLSNCLRGKQHSCNLSCHVLCLQLTLGANYYLPACPHHSQSDSTEAFLVIGLTQQNVKNTWCLPYLEFVWILMKNSYKLHSGACQKKELLNIFHHVHIFVLKCFF